MQIINFYRVEKRERERGGGKNPVASQLKLWTNTRLRGSSSETRYKSPEQTLARESHIALLETKCWQKCDVVFEFQISLALVRCSLVLFNVAIRMWLSATEGMDSSICRIARGYVESICSLYLVAALSFRRFMKLWVLRFRQLVRFMLFHVNERECTWETQILLWVRFYKLHSYWTINTLNNDDYFSTFLDRYDEQILNISINITEIWCTMNDLYIRKEYSIGYEYIPTK